MSFKLFLRAYINTNLPTKTLSYSNYQKFKNAGASTHDIEKFSHEHELSAFREYFLYLVPKVLIPFSLELIESGKFDFGHLTMLIHCNLPKNERFEERELNDKSVAWLRKSHDYCRKALLRDHKDALEKFMSLNMQGAIFTAKCTLLSHESIFWAYGVYLLFSNNEDVTEITEVLSCTIEQLYPSGTLTENDKAQALTQWTEVLDNLITHKPLRLSTSANINITKNNVSNTSIIDEKEAPLYQLLVQHFEYLWINFNKTVDKKLKKNNESSAQLLKNEHALAQYTVEEAREASEFTLDDEIEIANALLVEKNERKQEEFEVLCQFLSDTYVSEQTSTESLWVDLNKKGFSKLVLGYYSVTAISMYNGIVLNKSYPGISIKEKQKRRAEERSAYLTLMCEMNFKMKDDEVWGNFLSVVQKITAHGDIFGDKETKDKQKLKSLIKVFVQQAAIDYKSKNNEKRNKCKTKYNELITSVTSENNQTLLLESFTNKQDDVALTTNEQYVFPSYEALEALAIDKDNEWNKGINKVLDAFHQLNLISPVERKPLSDEYKKLQASYSRLFSLAQDIRASDEYNDFENNTKKTMEIETFTRRVCNFLLQKYSPKKENDKNKAANTVSVNEWKALNSDLCAEPLLFENETFPQKKDAHIFTMYRKVWQAIESSNLSQKTAVDEFQLMYEALASNVKHDKRLQMMDNNTLLKLDEKKGDDNE